jgi:hypothetical protein
MKMWIPGNPLGTDKQETFSMVTAALQSGRAGKIGFVLHSSLAIRKSFVEELSDS